jgi:hypothetical protein
MSAHLLILTMLAVGPGASDPTTAIVAAERAFAKRCGVVGIRASFLEFFAADAVSFAPDPGPARPRLEARPAPKEPPPILLEWGPEQAEAAPGGELGWTAGPSKITDKAGKRPPQYGYYFSLWRKQRDGTFKVVLDMGTDTPPAAIPAAVNTVGRAYPASGDVRREDEAFCQRAASDVGDAYAATLSAGARVHRERQAPMVGEARWRKWVQALAGGLSCHVLGGASVPGLGYTYGRYERRDKNGAILDQGFYTRVWRFEGTWKIAADVANLVK